MVVLFNIVLEFEGRTMEQEQNVKDKEIDKRETKLPSLADRIIYVKKIQ